MRYLSVCSGIEAASVAWHPIGWEPVAFSEIEKFPSAVLAHHYPKVPNLGDMIKFHEWPDFSINLLVGGTPCQAFSVAGLREGLADPRGNLTLTFLGVAAKYRPEWVVWENVPGVLSSTNGQPESQPPDQVGLVDGEECVVSQEYEEDQAFAAFLAGLAELGYGCAYRIFDAQYFGVAQRRRRVFVVGCLGDPARAAQVLFEPEGMSGNPPPSRQARKDVAPTLAARAKGGGGHGTDFDCDGGVIPIQEPGKRTGRSTTDNGIGLGIGEDGDQMYTLQAGAVHGVAVSPCLKGNAGKNSDAAMEAQSLVTHTLKGEGFDASEDGTGRGTLLVPVKWPAEIAPTLNASFGDKQGLEDQHALNGGVIRPLRNA